MKKITLGVFATREAAETAINALTRDLGIDTNDISYVYKNVDNEIKEVDIENVDTDDTGGNVATGAASGAVTGGVIGALAGLATVAGIIPVIGPIFAAGPLLAAMGIGAGAVGTAAATGVAAGSLIGALSGLGVSETRAKEYEDRVFAGDVLLAVHSENEEAVEALLLEGGAVSIETYTPALP